MQRASGILMPVFSLPSPYGIGSLGAEAYSFADFLSAAAQSYWQVLPIGPTSYGDSPYQSFSSFAGNPYFIDLTALEQSGLLKLAEIEACDFGLDNTRIDYCKLYKNRLPLLEKAYNRINFRLKKELAEFKEVNSFWLDDYALFMAVKENFGMVALSEWPDEAIRLRQPEALAVYRKALADRVDFHCFLQMLFFQQFAALKNYCNKQGIRLVGDLPIYVPADSADFWASPQLFQVDKDYKPTYISGCPPDSFSDDGQLWGTPVYDWPAHKNDHYAWWRLRVKAQAELFDVIRIDHFRGLESYWRVPAEEETARNGEWVKGPGLELIRALQSLTPAPKIIAEDLGFLTTEVRELLHQTGYPGMKVLQFAFNSRECSDYLPHFYNTNSVCYTGTHDNTTVAAWFDEAAEADKKLAVEYLGLSDIEGYNWGLLRGGLSSVSKLFIAPLADYLNLGLKARINIPGTTGGNWTWRLDKNLLTKELADKISRMTYIFGREGCKKSKTVCFETKIT